MSIYQPYNDSKNRKIRKHILIMRCVLLVFLFLFSSVVFAGNSLSSVLEKSRFTDDEKDSIFALFREAEKKEIPFSLLLPRLEEGIAKNVPYNKLFPVLSGEISCLESARDLLLSLDSELPAEYETIIWLRTCILLSNNVPLDIIYKIARKSCSRWEDYRDATTLFLSLIQWGLTDEQGVTVVTCLLDSTIQGNDFIGMITLFTRGRSMRIPPDELIDRILEAVDSVKTMESLEEKILF